IAALQAMVLAERLLHWVHRIARRETFDRRDLAAVGLHREHRARLHRLSVEQDGARAARRRVATHVGAGETARLAQVVDEQLAGADQYATALAVSHGWTSASSVVVASGDAWPDAIAASSLGRPVILTGRDALPSGAPDELRRLGAREAVVVGGTDAIGPGVRDQLRSMGLSLVEVAGADRYDTAAHVATLVPATGDAVVASGATSPRAGGLAAGAA